jgi:hypothetical protein
MLDQHFEKSLFTHPTDFIPAASLFIPKNPNVNSCFGKDIYQGPGHLLHPGVIGSGTAYIKEYFWLVSLSDIDYSEAFCPF